MTHRSVSMARSAMPGCGEVCGFDFHVLQLTLSRGISRAAADVLTIHSQDICSLVTWMMVADDRNIPLIPGI